MGLAWGWSTEGLKRQRGDGAGAEVIRIRRGGGEGFTGLGVRGEGVEGGVLGV